MANDGTEGSRRRGFFKRRLSRRDFLRLSAVAAGASFLAGCRSLGLPLASPTLTPSPKVEGDRDQADGIQIEVGGVEVRVSSTCFQNSLVNSSESSAEGGIWEPEDQTKRFLLILLMVTSAADLEALRNWPTQGESNGLSVLDEEQNESRWSLGIPIETETGEKGVYFAFLVDRTTKQLAVRFPDGQILDLGLIPQVECLFG